MLLYFFCIIEGPNPIENPSTYIPWNIVARNDPSREKKWRNPNTVIEVKYSLFYIS